MGFYVDSAAQKALKNYKYSGSDLSMTYKYLLSPWAQWCVDNLTPVTMARKFVAVSKRPRNVARSLMSGDLVVEQA